MGPFSVKIQLQKQAQGKGEGTAALLGTVGISKIPFLFPAAAKEGTIGAAEVFFSSNLAGTRTVP